MKSHPTKNDLPDAIRSSMVELIGGHLASAVHLTLLAKQAHWNVKGPGFFSLHGLFDEVYDHAGDWADGLAERAVQLGGVAATSDLFTEIVRGADKDLWMLEAHLEGRA